MSRQYRYKAFDRQGACWQEGEITATSADAAVLQLRRRGWQVARLERQYRWPWKRRRRWSRQETAFFATQLATLLDADVDLIRSMEMLAGTYGGTSRQVLTETAARIRAGSSAAQALAQAQVWPLLFVRLVEVGERSGTLTENLRRAAAYFAAQERARRAWQEALAYPATVAVLAVVVTVILLTVVLPTFGQLFDQLGVVPSGATQWLLLGGEWMRTLLPWLALGMGILVIGGWTGNHPSIRRRRQTLMWRWKPYRYRSLAVLCHVWGLTLAGGIDVAQGLDVTGDTLAESAYGIRLKQACRRVLQGTAPAEALCSCGIEEEILLHMVAVGTDTGRLAELLHEAGAFYEEQAAAVTRRYKSRLGPAVLVGVGAVVAMVMYGMLLPILDAMTMPIGG